MLQPKRLQSLPDKKQTELAQIVSIMLDQSPAPIHFIILFGGYARGQWVDDVYAGKDRVTYSYQSDYNLLVGADCPPPLCSQPTAKGGKHAG